MREDSLRQDQSTQPGVKLVGVRVVRAILYQEENVDNKHASIH